MEYTNFLSILTALFVAILLTTLLIGYARALVSRQSAISHLVESICLVFFAYTARSVYWDSGLFIPIEELNIVFNLIAIWGGVHGHIAFLKMIPDEDRPHWRVFTAWLYPPFAMSRCFRHIVSKVMRWRS